MAFCAQGWLGRSEYVLSDGRGPGGRALVVRWWQDRIAWATDSALMVGACV